VNFGIQVIFNLTGRTIMFKTINKEVNNNNGFARKSKFLTVLLMPIALIACGGGGGSTPTSGSSGSGSGNGGGSGGTAPYNQRISEAVMDFDNNGQTDARVDYVYFADGRINMMTYVYTGDGTTDLYAPYYNAGKILRAETEFSYDASGKLSGFKITLDNGSTINNAVYSYNGNQFIQSDTTVTSGGSDILLTGVVSYTNDLASEYNYSTAGSVIVNYQFTYNASMQVIKSVQSFTGSTNPVTSTYQWNGDGSLEKISNADTFSTWDEEFVYNGGKLQQKDFTFSNPPTDPYNTNVSWIYTYTNGALVRTDFDLNMDGSIDGTVKTTVESGPCTPVYLNIPDDISGVGSDGIPGSEVGIVWCG